MSDDCFFAIVQLFFYSSFKFSTTDDRAVLYWFSSMFWPATLVYSSSIDSTTSVYAFTKSNVTTVYLPCALDIKRGILSITAPICTKHSQSVVCVFHLNCGDTLSFNAFWTCVWVVNVSSELLFAAQSGVICSSLVTTSNKLCLWLTSSGWVTPIPSISKPCNNLLGSVRDTPCSQSALPSSWSGRHNLYVLMFQLIATHNLRLHCFYAHLSWNKFYGNCRFNRRHGWTSYENIRTFIRKQQNKYTLKKM